MTRRATLSILFAMAWLSWGKTTGLAAKPDVGSKPPLSASYGFLPPEIYKLDFRIANLIARDVNQDGLTDLVVVNNLKNRIDILQQRKDPNDKSDIEEASEPNEIVSDWRLRHRKIAMSRPVGALAVKDVNNDRRPDLVYLGEPPGLYVEYQRTDGSFGQLRSFPQRDAQKTPWAVDVGDLNSDGLNDVVFLGTESLYLVYQQKNGRLDSPKRFPLSEGGASLVRIVDFDANGTNDVVYLSKDDDFPVRIRFQDKTAGLGPERRFAIDAPHGVAYENVDGKPGMEMLTISSLSGRLVIYTLAQADKNQDGPTSYLVIHPFEKSGADPQSDLAVADFDGDKRTDVVRAQSDAARLVLHRQVQGDGLGQGEAYPGMLGTRVLRVIGSEAEGAELLSLSDREKAIGVSRFRDGRLTFPQALPTEGEPVVMEVLHDKSQTRLLYLARTRAPGSFDDKYALRALTRVRGEGKANTTWKPLPLGGKTESMEFSGKPNDLRAVDVNADGQLDLVFFFFFQPPTVWLADGKGQYTAAPKSSQGALGEVSSSAVFFGKLEGDRPELLVAQDNFARKMRLDSNGRWRVLDQYNAADSNANVRGVQALDMDNDGKPELAMYDRETQSVIFLKRRDGLFRRWRELKVGAFDLAGMRVADFDSDGKRDLLLFDADKMGIAYTDKQGPELRQIASYETDIRKGKLLDMVPGDLNGDHQVDILLLEPVQHHVEILARVSANRWQRALRWQVFEEKTFRRGLSASSVEPREAVVSDVDNDGLNDIVLLAHDRVLVYLQDSGESTTGER